MHNFIKRSLAVALMCCLVVTLISTAGTPLAAEANSAGQSILVNGDFEAPLSGGLIPGWKAETGSTLVSLDTVRKYSGNQSLKVERDANSPAVGVKLVSDKATVQAGKEYKLSTDLYLDSGDIAGIYVYVYNNNDVLVKHPTGTNHVLFIKNSGVASDGPVNKEHVVTRKQWTHLENTFVIPSGGTKLEVQLITSNSRQYAYNLDNIAVTLVPEADPEPPFQVPATAIKVSSSDPATKEISGQSQAVAPFQNVGLNAKTAIQSGAGGKVDLRFYDQNDQILSIVSANVEGTVGQWKNIRVAAAAPLAAAKVRAVMHIPGTSQGIFYVDELQVQVKATPEATFITNLGPQSMTTTAMYGAYGKYKGRDVLYTVVQGSPAELAIIDVNKNTLLKRHQLKGLDGSDVTAAWGVAVASDGKAYLGSTPNGTLFQFDPVTDTLRTLGKPVPSDTVIWALEPGDNGKIYGGTGYSQSVFEYDPNATSGDGMRILKSFGGTKPNQHIRSLAYDSTNKMLYAGAADVAKLYRIDTVTGSSVEIPIPNSSGKTSVYDLEFAGGKLFVRVDAGPLMYVYNPATNQWDMTGNAQYNARGFSPLSPDNRVFYTFPVTGVDGSNQFKLYQYNVGTGQYGPIDVNVKGVAVAYGYVELEDPDFPGVSLVGMAGNNGMSFWYNLQTGNVKTLELPLPSQFAEIHNIGKGPNGDILTSGFISGGGLGIYSPVTDTTELKPLLGQVEGYANINQKVYFGIYPNAVIFEYDTTKEWNRTDSSKPMNPVRIGPLGQEQERPVAMVGVEELNKVFIGTYPKAGQIGGALSIFDPATQTSVVKRNIVADHSINSLVYKDGLLYMGTGAMNGGSAQLVIYNTTTNQVVSSHIPVADKKAISSLIWGPDGNIWGMALGTLFIFDPTTKQVIYQDDKFPTADYAHSNARLEVGKDNHVYGSLYTGYVADNTYTGKMFKIDRVTKQLSIIFESNVERLMQDDYGDFYFKYGSLLMKYSDLTAPIIPTNPQQVQIDTNISGMTLTATRHYDEKGNAIDHLRLDETEVNKLLSLMESQKLKEAELLLPTHNGAVKRSIEFSKEAAKQLTKAKIEISLLGDEGKLTIPGKSLQGPKEDIYIHWEAVLNDQEVHNIEQSALNHRDVKKEAKNYDITTITIPMAIYSNLHNEPLLLTLPLHSTGDGNKKGEKYSVYYEVQKGKQELENAKLVSWNTAGQLALQVEVDKFSTRQKPSGLTAIGIKLTKTSK